jgi:predicted Fe-Mo cluster-binding NifX family protein
MKIAIAADGIDLNSNVASRLGAAEYILVIDLETREYEALPNPGRSHHRGGGVQAVMLAAAKEVSAVLAGHCSPAIRDQFSSTGIEIRPGIHGTVTEAVDRYIKDRAAEDIRLPGGPPAPRTGIAGKDSLIYAAKRSMKQFSSLLPVLASVIFLIGIFNALVSKKLLTAVFSGNAALDTVLGACFGSIFAGNPINSYIIGGELLKYNVSLVSVAAFLISWVTVGFVQLPAEAAALGFRFAFLRNLFSFISAIVIAILTALILSLAGRIP